MYRRRMFVIGLLIAARWKVAYSKYRSPIIRIRILTACISIQMCILCIDSRVKVWLLFKRAVYRYVGVLDGKSEVTLDYTGSLYAPYILRTEQRNESKLPTVASINGQCMRRTTLPNLNFQRLKNRVKKQFYKIVRRSVKMKVSPTIYCRGK